jgi:Domain of Unknown Function (DUF1259)
MNRREFDDRGNQNFFRGSGRNDTNFEMDNEMDNEFDNEFDNELELTSESQMNKSKKRNTHDRHGNVGGINASTCQQLADIIGGMVVTATPVCVVQRLRNIRATILDRRTRSPLALPFALSFENNGLNLGESVILQREINPLLSAFRRRGIIVTAVHNHWLFDEPRLMYMHWENVGMDPFEFARTSVEAAREAGLF